MKLIDWIVREKIVKSKSEARRLFKQHAFRLVDPIHWRIKLRMLEMNEDIDQKAKAEIL